MNYKIKKKKKSINHIVDGHFGSPSEKEKPNNADRKYLVNG